MKHTFTQSTNDLRHLLRAVNASRRDRKIVALPETINTQTSEVAIRRVLVKSVMKETKQDADTSRAINKMRGMK